MSLNKEHHRVRELEGRKEQRLLKQSLVNDAVLARIYGLNHACLNREQEAVVKEVLAWRKPW